MMINIGRRRCVSITYLLTVVSAHILSSVVVNATNTFTWSPSISLTSDLDEPKQLGFCLDIKGFRDNIDCSNMQAHSCKSAGADTQFEYYAPTKSIRAVNYDENCGTITISNSSNRACVFSSGMAARSTLALTKCDEMEANQNFEAVKSSSDNAEAGSYEIHLAGTNLCVVVNDTTRQAGSYVARNLFLSDCASVKGELKTWTIAPIPQDDDSDSSVTTPPPTNNTANTTNTTNGDESTEAVAPIEEEHKSHDGEDHDHDEDESVENGTDKTSTAKTTFYSFTFVLFSLTTIVAVMML